MIWTNVRPTVPGWYWTTEEWDDEPLLFEVVETADDGLYCGEGPLGRRAWNKTWWAGPIEIPKPPSSGDSNA